MESLQDSRYQPRTQSSADEAGALESARGDSHGKRDSHAEHMVEAESCQEARHL